MGTNNSREENTTSFLKRRGSSLFTGPVLTTIVNIIVWLTMGIFYLGVHKTEMHNLKQAYTVTNTKIEILQSKIETLEKNKNLSEQQNGTFIKDLNNHDVRIVRLEEAYSKIALLGQKLEAVEKHQDEMRIDLKDLPKIQAQLVELKNMIEKYIAK